jgi:uncharacterized membrane protein YGL010W
MKTLVDHLSTYAAYHRDRRNVATHFVGIPLIVVAAEALLARASFSLGALSVSPALVASVASVAFYASLDRRYALTMAGFFGAALALGSQIAALHAGPWLALSVGLFVVGWIFQFVGHFFEGRKPAFLDDLRGLLVGPLFVVAEAGFALGLRDDVREAVEGRAGPTHAGRAARI